VGIVAGDDEPVLPGGAWIAMAPDAQWIHCIGGPFETAPRLFMHIDKDLLYLVLHSDNVNKMIIELRIIHDIF
jgi:hypothetical protein